MANVTLGTRIVSASVVRNQGASSLTNAGTVTLTFVVEGTAAATAVPLAAGKAVSPQDPQTPIGLVATTGLTLTYDDTTGVFVSLLPT